MKPTPLFSKPVVDPVNTAAWFLMDALWLAKLATAAYVAAGVTVLTGLLLLALDRRAPWGERFADLGMNCWIAMNVAWCVADLNGYEAPRSFAAAVAVLGALFLAAAMWHSQELRRVRVFPR